LFDKNNDGRLHMMQAIAPVNPKYYDSISRHKGLQHDRGYRKNLYILFIHLPHLFRIFLHAEE
jgi:hypothetical protein